VGVTVLIGLLLILVLLLDYTDVEWTLAKCLSVIARCALAFIIFCILTGYLISLVFNNYLLWQLVLIRIDCFAFYIQLKFIR
jgi:hypothetical protein